jgi:hypothetical protein
MINSKVTVSYLQITNLRDKATQIIIIRSLLVVLQISALSSHSHTFLKIVLESFQNSLNEF